MSVSSPEPRSLRMSLTAAETSGNSVLELVKKEETGASVTGMLSSMAWSLAKAVMRSDRSGSSVSADTNLTGLGKFLEGDLSSKMNVRGGNAMFSEVNLYCNLNWHGVF